MKMWRSSLLGILLVIFALRIFIIHPHLRKLYDPITVSTPTRSNISISRLLPILRVQPRALSRLYLADDNATNTKYAYCSIGKNGCTYQLAIIHRIHGIQPDWKNLPSIHEKSLLKEWQAEYSSDKKVRAFLEGPVERYVIVRNPIMRTLSAYRDKIEGFYSQEKRREAQPVTLFSRWVFEQFPHNANIPYLRRIDIHWMPQTLQCGFDHPGFLDLFRVFRFEEPESNIDYIERLVPEHVLKDGWGEQNTSFRRFVTEPHLRTGNTSEIFWQYYANVGVFDQVAKAMVNDTINLGYKEEVDEMRRKLVEMNA